MIKRRGRPGATRRSPTGQAFTAEAWVTPATLDLLKTIVALRSVDEAQRFLRDLCTIPELHTLAARWQVARLLDQGVHYAEIARRTGASTATITRINTWRRYGTGGYRLLLDRTEPGSIGRTKQIGMRGEMSRRRRRAREGAHLDDA